MARNIANCTNCIHENVCYRIEHYGRILETDKPCKDFHHTADVVEVRHGEWEILHTAIIDTIGKCTNCGGEAVWRTRLKPYTLCPHCGAKMDGKGEGE